MRGILLGLGACVISAGCDGGGDGEPIDGTITIDWGPEHIVPTVGAAIENTAADTPQMLILIGTRDMGCETTLESRINPGTYVSFSVGRALTGPASPLITVFHVEPGSAQFRGSTGTLTIDGNGDRITGSLMVETTDDEVGPITAQGTFDVMRCF